MGTKTLALPLFVLLSVKLFSYMVHQTPCHLKLPPSISPLEGPQIQVGHSLSCKPGTSLYTMSCMTRSSLRLSSGCVSWILMLHMGQYLLVWRYFTIQLLQTEGREKRDSHTLWESDSWAGWGAWVIGAGSPEADSQLGGD